MSLRSVLVAFGRHLRFAVAEWSAINQDTARFNRGLGAKAPGPHPRFPGTQVQYRAPVEPAQPIDEPPPTNQPG